ncbi:MAG: hypothetical protein NUW12_11895 [Firmicutes bacterium]|nr:hypothetical protein [Bacillota bacterium]MDH7496565.1 hypothetical protein [Bacillota bacterium]
MKCRQALKGMMEILQRSQPGSTGSGVCSIVSKLLNGVRVLFVDTNGRVAGDSVVVGREGSGGSDGQSAGAHDDDWRLGDVLAPRTLASLWAAVAGKQAAAITVNGRTNAVAPMTALQETVGLLVALPSVESSRDCLDMLGPLAVAAGAVLAVTHRREEDQRARDRRAARSAVQNLSYSELVAVRAIVDALDGDQGFLVASRIADSTSMTRSVVVNALRKLSSADLVKTKSLGMKGTFVRILNPELRAELDNTGLGREALRGLNAGASATTASGKAHHPAEGGKRRGRVARGRSLVLGHQAARV